WRLDFELSAEQTHPSDPFVCAARATLAKPSDHRLHKGASGDRKLHVSVEYRRDLLDHVFRNVHDMENREANLRQRNRPGHCVTALAKLWEANGKRHHRRI